MPGSNDAKGAAEMPRRSPPSPPPFNLFVESVTDYGIFSIDPDGCINDWNTGAERMFGYRESEILGEHYRIIFTPEDRAAGVPEQEMATAQARGRADDTRWHMRKDGSRFWVEGINHAARDEAGNLIGFAKVCRDMTEHRSAEEALHAAHQRSEEILESIADAFYALDRNFCFTYVNRRCEQLWGMERKDLLGKQFWETFPQAVGSDAYRQHIRAAAERRPVRYQAMSPIFGKWVEASIYPAADGGLTTYFQDISERKAADERLRESEERFRATFEQAAVGMAHVGLDGRWLRVNQRLADKIGYTREELLATTFQDITCPDDLNTDLAYVQQLLAGDIQNYAMDKRYIRKDGTLLWVTLTVSLVRNEAGDPLYFIAVIEDISARKAAEEALARYHAHVQALNEQLQGAMIETHHRVKNNLQQIAAFLDLRLTDEDLPASHRADFRRLNGLVLALAALHDILTAQAKNYGQTDSVSSKDFLDKIINLLGQSSHGRQIRSDIKAQRLSTKVASALAIVLNELVSNALKHSSGDVQITFDVAAHIGRLRVCDNGSGFPPNFDPRSDANTGLQLVEMLSRYDLGGQALYENREGGGGCVTVTMTLPHDV